MGGALTHISIGLVSALIVHFRHFKLEYSLAIFVGNLLPDAIRNSLSAAVQGTYHLFNVEEDATYLALSAITGDPQNWFSLGFFVLLTSWLMFHYHVIKRNKMMEYDELYVFLLIGIVTHLIIDVIVIESSPWI